MYSVLVIDEGPMDLQISKAILQSGVNPVTVFCSDCLEKAIVVLKSEAVDLVIIDMPNSTPLIRDFLNLGRLLHPGLAVLLTSVMREEELLPLVVKLNANAYLLKPFRADQLLSAINPMLAASAEAEEMEGLAEQQAYLSRLSAASQDYSYCQAEAVIKEFLDSLYQSTDNMALVRARIVKFADGLVGLKEDLEPDLRRKLSGDMERFRTRFDLQGNKYQARVILEGMLNVIFQEMERESIYANDSMKKVLNYIDRNVKKGITLDNAADYINMSSSYFSKFFKKRSGVNFIDYVIERKIAYAKNMLLDTDMLVSNIACELSFRETNYFSKAFKKKVGLTPSEYREKNHISPASHVKGTSNN